MSANLQPEEPRPSDLVQDELPTGSIAPAQHVTVEDIHEALMDVMDPELMINIVDLGLVYDIRLDEDGVCTIDTTLTSPACPLTDQLEWDIHNALEGLVAEVVINWVWLPPWTIDRITPEGREQLRAMGFSM